MNNVFYDASRRLMRVHGELTDRGPRLLVQILTEDKKKMVQCDALVDTGADITSFEEDAIRSLGYMPHGKVTIQTAAGREERGIYNVKIRVPQKSGAKIVHVEVAGLGRFSNSVLPFGLIGRDVLRHGDLIYKGGKEEFELVLHNYSEEG